MAETPEEYPLDIIPDLQALEDLVWDKLQNPEKPSLDAWSLACLATIDGNSPRQRTVVMRLANRDEGKLWFHTDARTSKLTEIEANPNVSLAFYDPEHLMQVVMQAQASMVSEEERNQHWGSATDSSLRQYLAPFPPGKECSFSSCNLPDSARNRIPTRYELAEGYRHFRAVECVVHEIDIVVLRRVGNFRARFTKIDSEWQATWLQP